MYTIEIEGRGLYGLFGTWLDAIIVGEDLLAPLGLEWDWRML